MRPRRREDREGAKTAKQGAKEQKMEKDCYGFRGRPESKVPDDVEDLAHVFIGAAIEVHRLPGPGPLESVYQKAHSHELTLRGIQHRIEEPFGTLYKGIVVGTGRLDLFVRRRLIVELKSVESLTELHRSQAFSYLMMKNLPLSLLINFNVTFLKDGPRRVINTG